MTVGASWASGESRTAPNILWAPDNQHPASPAYAFQVDSEERVGLGLWDAGVLHLGIGAMDDGTVWVAESQCM